MKTRTFIAQLFILVLLAARAPLSGAEPDSAPEFPVAFTFEGGRLFDFVRSVRDQLKVDLDKEATFFENAETVQVPKMSVLLKSGWIEVLRAYNSVSRSTEDSIGSWAITMDDTRVNSIVFMLPRGGQMTIKGFSVADLNEQERKSLVEDIQREADEMRLVRGSLRQHRSGEIFLATGPREYVELVSALIEASKERAAYLKSKKGF